MTILDNQPSMYCLKESTVNINSIAYHDQNLQLNTVKLHLQGSLC